MEKLFLKLLEQGSQTILYISIIERESTDEVGTFEYKWGKAAHSGPKERMKQLKKTQQKIVKTSKT